MECTQCKKQYDVAEAKRVYGGLPWTEKMCSAFCYTESLEDADKSLDEPIKKFNKIIVGFVTQNFEVQEDGTYVCVGQNFEAGEVDYENDMSENVLDQLDTTKEQYCVMDMVQPPPIPNTDGLKFKCRNCEGTKLECCMDDGNSSVVTVIHEDGQFEYDGEPTEGELSHYQCECCGEWITDENGNEIQDDEEIVEWLKRECPQD